MNTNTLMVIYCIILAGLGISPWAWYFTLKLKANKKEKKGPTDLFCDSRRPDVPATRQWVEEMMNKNMSNVMHVGGTTHEGIKHRISRLERLNRQGGYLAFIDDKSVRELGFDYLCGTVHVGEIGETYRLVDITMKDGNMGNYGEIIEATIVEKDDKRYMANVEANFNHVCENYSGRGTEMGTEVAISKELADRLISEFKAKEA